MSFFSPLASPVVASSGSVGKSTFLPSPALLSSSLSVSGAVLLLIGYLSVSATSLASWQDRHPPSPQSSAEVQVRWRWFHGPVFRKWNVEVSAISTLLLANDSASVTKDGFL